MVAAAVVGAAVVGGVAKSVASSNAAKKEASTKAAADAEASNQQRSQLQLSTDNLNKQNETGRQDIISGRDAANANLNPFLTNGTGANNQLSYLLGTGGSDTSNGADGAAGSLAKPFTMSDFQQDPGYQFALSEGQKALARTQGAKGQYFSGAALKGLTDYNQGMANQQYSNAYDRYNTNQNNLYSRLAGLSNSGQGAANTISANDMTAGNQLAGYGYNTANSIANLGAGATNQIGANTIGQGAARAQGIADNNQAVVNGIGAISSAPAQYFGMTGQLPSGGGGTGTGLGGSSGGFI